jgi:hypothetical protein
MATHVQYAQAALEKVRTALEGTLVFAGAGYAGLDAATGFFTRIAALVRRVYAVARPSAQCRTRAMSHGCYTCPPSRVYSRT